MNIFLTGGSSGIGQAVYQLLNSRGYKVTAPSRKTLNLIDFSAIDSLDLSTYDVVINCAGANQGAYLGWQKNSWQNQQNHVSVNFTGPLLLAKQYTRQRATGQFVYITSASAILLAKLVDGCHAGITATCPGFYAPQGRNLRLGLSMPQLNDQLTAFRFGNLKITNFEMETAAIYGLGKMMGHHCLSLSAIVANRIAREFSADADATIDKLIRQVLGRV